MSAWPTSSLCLQLILLVMTYFFFFFSFCEYVITLDFSCRTSWSALLCKNTSPPPASGAKESGYTCSVTDTVHVFRYYKIFFFPAKCCFRNKCQMYKKKKSSCDCKDSKLGTQSILSYSPPPPLGPPPLIAGVSIRFNRIHVLV